AAAASDSEQLGADVTIASILSLLRKALVYIRESGHLISSLPLS
ncbi:hypothetical protein A2U01_0072417, partial [Trifolium medium]|nr:hypothetical protein [Trifolium medium]